MAVFDNLNVGCVSTVQWLFTIQFCCFAFELVGEVSLIIKRNYHDTLYAFHLRLYAFHAETIDEKLKNQTCLLDRKNQGKNWEGGGTNIFLAASSPILYWFKDSWQSSCLFKLYTRKKFSNKAWGKEKRLILW